MSEKGWRQLFLWGTAFFLVLLIGMTVDSLQKVSAGRTPAVSDQVARGKYVFQRRNCNDCHTILGIGGYFAPDLTKTADVRDAAWLQRFLADPKAAKPGTTMPDQRLQQADVVDLVAFLDWVRHIDTNGWPPQPLTTLGAAAAPGVDLPKVVVSTAQSLDLVARRGPRPRRIRGGRVRQLRARSGH